MFRKLKFDMIDYAYLNKSTFKYCIGILGGMGWGVCGHAYLAYLGGGPEFGKTYLYNTCMLPNYSFAREDEKRVDKKL